MKLTLLSALRLAAVLVLAFAASGAPPAAAATLQQNRDRLLDTYAQRFGQTRCQAWNGMTAVQKGVFLTITDLLGKRSFLYNAVHVYTKTVSDPCSPYGTDCTSGCDVWEDGPQICSWMSGINCASYGACTWQETQRTNFETALDHVTRIWAVNGNSCSASNPSCSCGGGDNHRLYFSANNTLIAQIRNFDWGLPEWHRSEDPKGPHAPFTNSSETITKMGTALPLSWAGQMHFWRWNHEAQVLNRPGVTGVYDPQIVEIDIDYAWNHPSNPECYYSGTYGRTRYQQVWGNKGLGGSPEYNYSPSPCP